MATVAKSRLTSKRVSQPKAKSKKAKKPRNGDEIWDELLATPESEAFLTLMIAEVRQEEAEGKLIEGGWSDAL
jgi:hypothetical protein